MLMLWIPGGALVTALIGVIGYIARRLIERRREVEALALLNQTADLCTKLQQSGLTLNELHALQDEVIRRGLCTVLKKCSLSCPTPLITRASHPAPLKKRPAFSQS
jgi:hypothetical protein